MKKRKNRALFAIVIACFLMGLVFYSSSMSYQEQSITSTIYQWFPNQPFSELLSSIEFQYAGQTISVTSLGYAQFIEFFIRKTTHFLIYFFIAANWAIAFRYYVKQKWLGYGLALLVTVLYAATDEYHQSLTLGRTALIQDVVLDSIGALFGTISTMLKLK